VMPLMPLTVPPPISSSMYAPPSPMSMDAPAATPKRQLELAQALPEAKRPKNKSESKNKCMKNKWWCTCRPVWPAQGRPWHAMACPRDKWARAYDADPGSAVHPTIGDRVTALISAGPRAGRTWEYRSGREGWVEIMSTSAAASASAVASSSAVAGAVASASAMASTSAVASASAVASTGTAAISLVSDDEVSNPDDESDGVSQFVQLPDEGSFEDVESLAGLLEAASNTGALFTVKLTDEDITTILACGANQYCAYDNLRTYQCIEKTGTEVDEQEDGTSVIGSATTVVSGRLYRAHWMAWEDNESNKVIGHRDAADAIIDLATCANKYGNMLYQLPGLIKCTRKVNGIASEYDIQFTACGENLGLDND
jgi:hypothetical protein